MAIRVLIIDDSVFMRSMLKSALSGTEGIEVIGTAQNGSEGLAKIQSLNPTVVTLDIEMPGMDGLEVLERVMKGNPLPIVMVSTKTQEGAEATLKALRLGAVDYVAKPLGEKSATLESFRRKVVLAVETAAASNQRTLGRKPATILPPEPTADFPPGAVVAIGISAGGPATLHEMIPTIPASFPPIVLTQHMPGGFTKPFAKRLNSESMLNVKEAEEGDVLSPGKLLIAPGNIHLRIKKSGSKMKATLDKGPKVSGFRPSVDVLFESVATTVGPLAVGVIMTGMGCDGSVGVRLFKKHGGPTIAQDKATSIVYGMPKAAFETGCIDQVVSLQKIPTTISTVLTQMQVTV